MANYTDPNKDARNRDARLDKRPNLAKIAAPDLNGYGTAARTSSTPVQDTGTAFGYDQSDPGGVVFGQSSSYKVSTGLVNALDVTQGVTQIVDDTNRALDTLDKNKGIRLQAELAAAQNEEGFEYLSPTEQFTKIRKIQEGYKDGWLTTTGRTNWRRANSKLDFEEKAYDLEAGLAAIQMFERRELNAGTDPVAVFGDVKPMYDRLSSAFGANPVSANRIGMARDTSRATTDSLRFKAIKNIVDGLYNDDKFKELTFGLDSDMSYPAWRDAAFDLVLSEASDEFRAALGMEWDENTNTFTGEYSERSEMELDAIMQPLYNERLSQRVASDQNANRSNSAMAIENAASIGAVNMIVDEDNYPAGAGRAHLIGSVGQAMSLQMAADPYLSPGERTQWVNTTIPGLVQRQLENSHDPQTDQPKLWETWAEILDDPTFKTNLYSFMNANTEEEQADADYFTRLAVESGFEAFKKKRRQDADKANQTKKSPRYKLGPFTDDKQVSNAIDNSAWAVALTEGSAPLPITPIKDEEGPFVMAWMHFAVEASFNRSMHDPSYTTEMAVDFKKEVAEWFNGPDGGMVDPKKLRERAEALGIRLKADFFTPSDDPDGYQNPYKFIKNQTNGDYQLVSDGTADSITVTLTAAASYMRTRQDQHSGEYFLDTDWNHAENSVFFSKFATKYRREMSESERPDMGAMTSMLLSDLSLVQDMFGQEAGASLFAGPILNGILNADNLNLGDGAREAAKTSLLGIIKNPKLSHQKKSELIFEQLDALKTRGRGFARIDTSADTKTNLIFVDEDVETEDVDWSAEILGTIAQGVRPDQTTRSHERQIDVFESIWELGAKWGVGLIGPEESARTVGKKLLLNSGSMLKFNDAMARYAQATDNKSFVRYDSNTKSVTFDVNAFEKNGIDPAVQMTKVLDDAGLELAVSFDKNNEIVDAQFVDRPVMQKRNERGQLVSTDGYVPAITGPFSDAFERLGSKVEDKYYDELGDSLRSYGADKDWYETTARMNDPHTRRYLFDMGTAASSVLTKPKIRLSIADRVEAQISVLANTQPEGWLESDGASALQEFLAELRQDSGPMPRTMEYYRRAQELAKAQEINPIGHQGDVGMYFLMSAVAMDAFDVSVWPHAPLDLIPRRADGFETEGSRRGLIPTMWTVDDTFVVNGRTVGGELQIPLFAPTTEALGGAFDPRFYYRQGRTQQSPYAGQSLK